ncbi:MAG: ATP-dependent Clp protease proteolytic subunit [Bdellovibrionota bacterium]
MTDEKDKGDKGEKTPTIEKELFEARIILISAGVDPKLAHSVNSKLLALERHNDKDPIYLYINSPGGEVHSGFSIFDTARFIKPTVVTVVTGLAASMGSIITLCAKPEHRFRTRRSSVTNRRSQAWAEAFPTSRSTRRI